MIKTVPAILTVAFTALLCGGAAGSEYVTVSASLEPPVVAPGAAFRLVVKAVVAEGFHVGSADKEALSPAELSVSAPGGIAFSKPVFPRGKWVRLTFADGTIPVYEGEFAVVVPGRAARNAKPGSYEITAVLSTQACKDDQCFPPEENRITAALKVSGQGSAAIDGDTSAPRSEEQAAAESLAGSGLLKRLALIYLGGLLLAFTPCVYPMIPVTVGYFSSQGEKSRSRAAYLALAYVFGIAITYAVLGTVAATTGGAIGNAVQSPAVLIGIAVVLTALALSMFGLYELRAPGFLQDKAFGRSGAAGALVMGLIFGMVAVPCAGPFTLGLAVYAAKVGSPFLGFVMFFVMAAGLGTPLFALAAFSARLPAPGMWMVTVQRIGGFVLLGAAAYFAGPVVPQPVRPYVIPAVVLAAGVYIGFADRSLKSTKAASIVGKLLFAALAAVALYLSWPAETGDAMEWTGYSPGAVAQAARRGKPSIVDFAADWCIACKELDHGPWSDPEVIAAARRFARFRVDGTRRSAEVRAAEQELGTRGAYPAVLFFDSQGREVRSARVTGFVDSREMIRRMKMVR